MIEVVIKSSRKELARIKIENISEKSHFADYSVQFAVDNGNGELAMYQRSVYGFNRKRFNALALLRLALEALNEKELSLDGDPDTTVQSDLARQLGRVRWPF